MLARYGIQADIQPQQEDSEHLALGCKSIFQNDRLVLVKADNDNRVLFEQLQEHAHVSLCKAYTVQELPFDLPQHVYDGRCSHAASMCMPCLGRLMECQDTKLKVYSMEHILQKALRSWLSTYYQLLKADKAVRHLYHRGGSTCIEEEDCEKTRLSVP